MTPISFRNDSGETIPSYAIVGLAYVASPATGRKVASGDQIVNSSNPWVVNSRVAVSSDGPGWGFGSANRYEWIAYESADGTPAVGDEWGPKADSWKLRRAAAGCRIVSVGSGVVFCEIMGRSGIRVAYCTQKCKKGQTKTFQLREGYGSSEAGAEIQVKNRIYGTISSGTPCYVSEIYGTWEVIAVNDDDESDSSSSNTGTGTATDTGTGTGDTGTGDTGTGTGTGDTGTGTGKDTAVVKADWSPGGYAALFVEESPEVRFNDVMVVEMRELSGSFDIDPRFVKVCERDTIEVCGFSVDGAVAVGARARNGRVTVSHSGVPGNTMRIVLRLTGIRKGFKGVRFPERTRDEFMANEAWLKRGAK
jgi:hypothetical protein